MKPLDKRHSEYQQNLSDGFMQYTNEFQRYCWLALEKNILKIWEREFI